MYQLYELVYCASMTICVSKNALSIYMLLIIVVVLQFEEGNSDFYTKGKVTVSITNNLINRQLGVHCKDKNNDIGFRSLQRGNYYEFTFRPNIVVTTLYFCRFT